MTQTALKQKCSTGINGLDDVLQGGLPRRRLYLIQGDPGVGKTTLALQFLLHGASQGERGLYITLSETKEELLAVANSHQWSLDPLALFELSAIEQQLAQDVQNTLFHPSDLDLNRTTKILLDEVERVRPQRVVFDSLSELQLLAENPLRYRRQILVLKQFFAGKDCTVLMLDDRATEGNVDLQVQSISHGVITLDKTEVGYGVQRRKIYVEKIRGVKFREGAHDYVIETGGIRVFPRLVAAEHPASYQSGTASSNVIELDTLLGGGLDRGTSTLIMGPAGTGKSIVALKYAAASAERGEKALYYVFDENLTTMSRRASEFGVPIADLTRRESLRIQQVDPAEITPGEFVYNIKRAVENENVRMVVLDSLIGYLQAMPDERFLNLHLHELLTFLGQQGVITILTLTQHGFIGSMTTPIDITYIADTVLMLRYFESAGQVKKAISVIKKRTGHHENTLRELRIDTHGIRVGEPLIQFQGVLTGTPQFKGAADQMLPERK